MVKCDRNLGIEPFFPYIPTKVITIRSYAVEKGELKSAA
jgi:hypothetical protein